MKDTVLDQAHAAMAAAPEDDAARLRFFERLADAELFLLLEREAAGDQIEPRLFPLADGPVALAFDTEERLTEFAGAAPYAALSGRILAGLVAGQGIGLGLNLEVAPSSMLLPSSALTWLVETLANAPEATEAQPQEFTAPGALPQALLSALDAKLPSAAGLAEAALLAGVTYADGRRGHMLAFLAPRPGAEAALAKAAGEALTFSGVEAGELDVAFLTADDPAAMAMLRVALRFDLPQPELPQTPGAEPGMNPERPPILR